MRALCRSPNPGPADEPWQTSEDLRITAEYPLFSCRLDVCSMRLHAGRVPATSTVQCAVTCTRLSAVSPPVGYCQALPRVGSVNYDTAGEVDDAAAG